MYVKLKILHVNLDTKNCLMKASYKTGSLPYNIVLVRVVGPFWPYSETTRYLLQPYTQFS